MKIREEDYEYLKNEMVKYKDSIKAHRVVLIKEGKAKDIEKRLRWDIFNACELYKYACDVLYKYVNDTHIDTALKQIVKEIEPC